MREFGFTCAYTTTRDPARTSPCGRTATSRTGGEAKCLGHWVVAEAARGYGRTGSSARTWGGVYGYLALLPFFALVDQTVGLPGGSEAELSGLGLLVLALATCYTGGLAVAVGLEHRLGSLLWLLAAPLGAAAVAAHGAAVVTGADTTPLAALGGHGSGSLGTLSLGTLSGDLELALAVALAAVWLGFLLHYHHRYGWLPWLNLLATVATVGFVVGGVALTLVDGGGPGDMVSWGLTAVGSVVLLVGAARLKKLVMRLRV
ncbi:hypothetical protein [Streptomyces sp. NPDC048172]|uniref:hypothetical protein n=1 Tax=Streptomyces sp. NPDC048172 TaxID=3365505 RepID=UPI00371CF98C